MAFAARRGKRPAASQNANDGDAEEYSSAQPVVRRRLAAARHSVHDGGVKEHSAHDGGATHDDSAEEYSSAQSADQRWPAARHNAPDGGAEAYSSAQSAAHRGRHVCKRPAARGRDLNTAPVSYEPPDTVSVVPSGPAPQPAWAYGPLDGESWHAPPWADHIVHTLIANGHLPRRADGKRLVLQLWSDCSGINSEMFSWAELRDAILRIIGADVALSLYYTCDSDSQSLAFARRNHGPLHASDNITQRNFSRGEFWDTWRQDNFPIPAVGVDLYVGTYPCSPWSRRGARTGWDHPAVQAMHIGLQTLSYIQPAVWIVEVGELHEHASLDEVGSSINDVLMTNGRAYVIQPVRHLGPATQGIPMRRPRTFFIGYRHDVCPDLASGTHPLQSLIQNPAQMMCSYRSFLRMTHPYDWASVGHFAVGAALEYMSGNPCLCACDPYVKCPVHPCKCDKCGPDGLRCKWRKHILVMIEKEGIQTQAASMAGKMTYMNCLEMQGGTGPKQQRTRILLNTVALLPQSLPLQDSMLLVDKSQNPPFGSWPADGMVPTLTTSSQLWCMSAGRELQTWELAALMGFDCNKMDLSHYSEAWFRKRLGMAVHVPNFGLVMAAAMSHALRQILTAP